MLLYDADIKISLVWESRSKLCNLNNKYKLLILASIVEKETALLDERPRIAAVFLNRLKMGMRLQADPTLVYGLMKTNLEKSDMKKNFPYNTYLKKGLPPTPICCPSKNSLIAVEKPYQTNDLYFVKKGNSDKCHNFSENYNDHRKNIKILKKYKN